MAGFPLGRGGHSRGRDDHHHHHHPPVHPAAGAGADSSSAAAFLYTATATSRGGFQLWQQQPEHPFYAPNIIRFADDPAASGSSSRGTRGLSSGAAAASAAGTISCQDCGNQAKKDCAHMRCRTCCKSRGFDCPTHVKSTWVPASKRRERQQQLAAAPTAGEPSKRSRDAGQPSSTTATTTSSGEQQQMVAAERFPREVSSEAVFRCVRLGPVDEADAEVAYQTTVSIGGHMFKGILHDVGPDPSLTAAGIRLHAGEGSSPSTAAAGEAGSVAGTVSSSAVVMDPYPTPGPFGAYGGAHFFHGHPR